jgi:hypothetical protein
MTKHLNRIHIKPTEDKQRFQFHLQFGGNKRSDAIAFEMTGAESMYLLKALQILQLEHKIPIPADLRPRGGRPVLSVVESEC